MASLEMKMNFWLETTRTCFKREKDIESCKRESKQLIEKIFNDYTPV